MSPLFKFNLLTFKNANLLSHSIFFPNHIPSSHQMTADQACQVQQEITQVLPCPDSHPAVSSTPRVEGPPPVTCP